LVGNLGDQIRGWKEIAASVNASVRTAQRWERLRQLPVRRRSGDRDGVFMLASELKAWLMAGGGGAVQVDDVAPSLSPQSGQEPVRPIERTELVSVETPEAPGLPATVAARRPQRRREWLLPGLGILIGAVVASAWFARAKPTDAPLAQKPVQVHTFNLRVSRPDGWQSVLTIADGGAGQFGGLPGQPAVVLRPRVVDAGLMVEVARIDGRPVIDSPGPPTPFVLLLEPNTVVAVRRPFPFDIEWAVDTTLPVR
jgi:hypothetical protein